MAISTKCNMIIYRVTMENPKILFSDMLVTLGNAFSLRVLKLSLHVQNTRKQYQMMGLGTNLHRDVQKRVLEAVLQFTKSASLSTVIIIS